MESWSLPCPSTCCRDAKMGYRLVINGLSARLGDADRTFTLETGHWTVSAGETIALTGPSGTGKTLLLELLGLMRAPQAGAYYAEGEDGKRYDFAAAWSAADARARCAEARAQFFGFVPQAGGLLPFMTVVENIALSQRIAGRPDAQWMESLIETLELAPLAKLYPDALSIGQRQRVAIARALAHRPFCVIADEPTAALDPEAAETAMALLIEAARVGSAATLVSSHDFATLARFSMRRMMLEIASEPEASDVVSRVTPATVDAAGATVLT